MRTRLIESAPALSLALTAVSCWVVGIAHAATYRTLVTGDEDAALRSVSPLDGVWFAAGILGILGAHELGHWWAARRHRVAVSPPLFIPGPTFAGTFGAFMRLRGRPRTRRCAFDIAAAGPLAGFATLLPVLWAGVALSAPAPLEAMETARAIGHPALLQAAVTLIHGPVGDGSRDRAAPAGDGSLDRNAADQPEPVPRRPARRRALSPTPFCRARGRAARDWAPSRQRRCSAPSPRSGSHGRW